MIEIWAESVRFNAASQRLANQARMIFLKNGWFSDLEKLEIWKQVNRQKYDQDSSYQNQNTKYGKTRAP